MMVATAKSVSCTDTFLGHSWVSLMNDLLARFVLCITQEGSLAYPEVADEGLLILRMLQTFFAFWAVEIHAIDIPVLQCLAQHLQSQRQFQPLTDWTHLG